MRARALEHLVCPLDGGPLEMSEWEAETKPPTAGQPGAGTQVGDRSGDARARHSDRGAGQPSSAPPLSGGWRCPAYAHVSDRHRCGLQ